MNCQDFHNYISPYIDDVLNDDEKQLFEKHLSQCEKCEAEYYNFKAMIESVNEIQEINLPKNFNEQLGEKLRKEKVKKNTWSPKRKIVSGVAAAVLLTVISAAMLSDFPNNKATEETADLAMGFGTMETADAPKLEDTGGAGYSMTVEDGATRSMENYDVAESKILKQESRANIVMENFLEESVATERQIIKRGNMVIEVDDFDTTHIKVLVMVEDFQGYIQHSDIYYNFLDRDNPENSLKSARIQLRVPSHDFASVFQQLKNLGIVVEENTSGEDITESYMDIDNQVENLKLQEERLREILQKAESVDELLRLENELNRIRTEINHLTGRLQSFDKLVSMSTINLDITQVRDKNIYLQSLDEGLWERSKNNFVASINNIIRGFEKIFLSFFSFLPILLLLALIGGPTGYFIYKKGWLKR